MMKIIHLSDPHIYIDKIHGIDPVSKFKKAFSQKRLEAAAQPKGFANNLLKALEKNNIDIVNLSNSASTDLSADDTKPEYLHPIAPYPLH